MNRVLRVCSRGFLALPFNRIGACLFSIVLATVLPGCGGEDYQSATGRVTLDGKPLADATIALIPENDRGIPSFGKTDSQGNYTIVQGRDLNGAMVGKYAVRIATFFEGIPEFDPPIPAVEEKVPAKYNVNTKLAIEVKPGKNVFDFDLESKGRIVQPDEGK